MQIGRVAKETGLTVDAIRFYERRRLLPHPSRSEGGFRLYTEGDVESLRFLRRMQSLGFLLDEIRDLLSLRMRNGHACQRVRDLLHVKLAAVRAKQNDLAKLEQELCGSLRQCQRALRKQRPKPHSCPVLSGAKRGQGDAT